MIKGLITDFFNEIEKKELKKNKNAQATFWVEELQEVTYSNKNYISVKKATRLYEKYIEEKENVSVREPNKYLLDFMCRYLGSKDFEEYQSIEESIEEIHKQNNPIISFNSEGKSFLKRHKKGVIGFSILIPFLILFIINKTRINDSETCILWNETHFEKSACAIINTIDNSIYNINIEKFKKIEVTKETSFFINGYLQVWYGKSATGKMEYFTQRGVHPETLKELRPITEYIINKYIITKKDVEISLN